MYRLKRTLDMAQKDKHTTFRFEAGIREAFQQECEINGVSMTDVLEKMMISYITINRKNRDGKTQQKQG